MNKVVLLIILAFCCDEGFNHLQAETGARQAQRTELRRISECCYQNAEAEFGLRERECFECCVREALGLPKLRATCSRYKHERGEGNMPKKFRKKPVVVEAIQLTWENWSAVCDFIPKPHFVRGVYTDASGDVLPDSVEPPRDTDGDCDHIGLYLNTNNGPVLAKENDWIVKTVLGDYYPCTPDVFEATHKEVRGERR